MLNSIIPDKVPAELGILLVPKKRDMYHYKKVPDKPGLQLRGKEAKGV